MILNKKGDTLYIDDTEKDAGTTAYKWNDFRCKYVEMADINHNDLKDNNSRVATSGDGTVIARSCLSR
jgi:hypothetical protein